MLISRNRPTYKKLIRKVLINALTYKELEEQRDELIITVNLLRQAKDSLPDSCDSARDDLQWIIDEVDDRASGVSERLSRISDSERDLYIDNLDEDRIRL